MTGLTLYRDSDVARVVDFFSTASHADPTLRAVSKQEWSHFIHQSQVRVMLCQNRFEKVEALLTTQLAVRADGTGRHFCIFVMPELRRQGRGRTLLEYLRRFEPSEDVTCLECRIQQGWRAGEAFLEREGFSPWRSWISLKYRANAVPLVAPIPGYSLKRLSPSDEVFRELERIARKTQAVEVHQSADDFRRQFENGMTFLALQDAAGGIVGFGAYEHEQGQCYWIDNLVVDPGLHRIGLGRWLLASLLSDLAEKPATIALQCEATATGALALYSSVGFVEDGRSKMFRGARRKYR